MDRRTFAKCLLGASALSIAELDRLTAAAYADIDSVNKDYLQDNSPDGVYWDAVRKHFIFHDGLIMMNNGTIGPMPEPVFNTLIKYCKLQVFNNFIHFFMYHYFVFYI